MEDIEIQDIADHAVALQQLMRSRSVTAPDLGHCVLAAAILHAADSLRSSIDELTALARQGIEEANR